MRRFPEARLLGLTSRWFIFTTSTLLTSSVMAQPFVSKDAATGFVSPPLLPADCASISSDQPYTSRFVDVLGSQMHYFDEGDPNGDVYLFLHGAPTSSYLWRNVVDDVLNHVPNARVIAPDSIGMGLSDRPPLAYDFDDHVRYLEGFIAALGLTNITLVVHDWGSAWGSTYADRHPANVRGVVLFEAVVSPRFPAQRANLPPSLVDFFSNARDPVLGPLLFVEQNFFIEQALPQFALCGLTSQAQAVYAAPYPNPEDREVLLRLPNNVPIDGVPANVVSAVSSYNQYLSGPNVPKLLMHVSPGALIENAEVAFLKANWQNLTTVDVGTGIHFLQESIPSALGRTIAKWSLDTYPASCKVTRQRKSGSGSDDILLAQGRDRLFGRGGDDQLSAAAGCGGNRIYGGSGDDRLTAGQKDRLFAGSGDDILDAAFVVGGGSRLYGDSGHDTFYLGKADRALGGSGDDTFYALQGGKNRLTGGAGQDAFWLATNGDLSGSSAGANVITDFQPGTDTLVVHGFGPVADEFGDVTVLPNGGAWVIEVAGQVVAKVFSPQALTAGDFQFVP